MADNYLLGFYIYIYRKNYCFGDNLYIINSRYKILINKSHTEFVLHNNMPRQNIIGRSKTDK